MRNYLPAMLFLMAAPLAWGHAVLLEASPQAGSSVAGIEIPVNLRFNSRVDAKRSRIAIVSSGKEEPVTLIPQTSPDRIAGTIRNAKPGPCKIRWQVLASDGHITRGELLFKVK